MRRVLFSISRFAAATALAWLSAASCFGLGANRSTCSMVLLLEVLAVSTLGDWALAIITSLAASLAFSWYFVDKVGSLVITSAEGGVTFSMMVITALTASQLSIRAQKRAEEAIRRRGEMERLQQLGNSLFASETVADAANNAVKMLVDLFGVSGASLALDQGDGLFSSGCVVGVPSAVVPISVGCLELYGTTLSFEVSKAVGNLIRLVLERARSGEERARMQASQRGEELRNLVLNALAHNFKTPLTSIKAAASVLRFGEGIAGSDAKDLVAVIDEEADRLDLLIRESLDSARIEAHQSSPRIEECSLVEVAASVTSRVSHFLSGREVAVEFPDTFPKVKGDRFLLGQMLMQVVDNAWKYSKPGSKIRIVGEKISSGVLITVQNEGSEIAPEERDKLFVKFYRGASNGTQVEGTGLGLAIARAIAEAHSGRVWLDMLPEGPAFRFSLPVEGIGEERLDTQSQRAGD